MISENSDNLDWPVLNCDHLPVYFFFYFSPHLLCFYGHSIGRVVLCSGGRRPSLGLTYYGDEHAVGVIIFLTRELALVLPLHLHAGHAGHHREVGDGVRLREARAAERLPVGEAGQSPGRPSGVDLALPLGALEVALLSQVSAAQVDLLSQEGCDILRELNTWTWEEDNEDLD